MSDRLADCYRSVLSAQLVLMVLAGIVAVIFFSVWHGLSVTYGAFLALANTWLAHRSVVRASSLAYKKADIGMLPIVGGLVMRLALFAGGIMIGAIIGNLVLPSILVGFFVLQPAYLACKT